jgi:serine/threonine protein kinase
VVDQDQDPLGIIGQTVEDKYRILALAGEGGFSAVYKAEHLIWNEPVAIKFFSILEAAKTELREKLLSDFIQEGKLMSQLSSRSAAIVQARDIGKLAIEGGDWIPYMVLEWLDGVSLDVVLRDERLQGMPPRTLEESMQLLEPAAIALDIAHQQKVAHRDLKPANFVIMGDPRSEDVPLKVLDFGIAKVMGEHVHLQEQLQLTGQQITAFTPNYGAPEQFSRNFGATGPWSDVYAMALIVIELLRGGDKALEGATFFELGVKSCDRNHRPTPRALGLDVPPEVEAVFAKALALDPRDRYSRMAEFWSDMHRAVYPDADTWRVTGQNPRARIPSFSSNPSNPNKTSNPSNPSDPSFASSDPLAFERSVPGEPESEMAPTIRNDRFDTEGSMSVSAPRVRRTPVLLVAALSAVVLLGIGAFFAFDGDNGATASPSSATPSEPEPPASSVAPAKADPPAPKDPEPVTSATAKASAKPPPRRTGTPPKPPPPTAPQASTNPWDPSSFGGRR